MSDQHLINNTAEESQESDRFFVVGIGASAGGVQALEEFFEHIVENVGAAFVVIQHLSPNFRTHIPHDKM